MLNARFAAIVFLTMLAGCQCPKPDPNPNPEPDPSTQPTTQPVIRSVAFQGALKLVNGDANGAGPKVYYITFPALPHRVSTDFGSLRFNMSNQHIQVAWNIADEGGTNLQGVAPQGGADIQLNERAWKTIDNPVTHANGTYQIMISVVGAVAPYTTGAISGTTLTFTTDDPAKK